MAAGRIAGYKHIVKIDSEFVRVRFNVFERGKYILHRTGKIYLGNQPEAKVHHSKAFFCKVHTILFIQFLIGIHPCAAVNINDSRKFSLRSFGTINVKQMQFMSVINVSYIHKLFYAVRRRLCGESFFVFGLNTFFKI